jgi:hypothetical protein
VPAFGGKLRTSSQVQQLQYVANLLAKYVASGSEHCVPQVHDG